MFDEDSLRSRMQKTVETVHKELTKIRTGIASPSILENVFVDYFGTRTPITQAASVSVPEPRMLAIKPWDKSLFSAIEKAIQASDLGLNPVNDGNVIRLNMPVLTADRRKELAKVCRKVGEEGKVAIRNIRRDENDHIKKKAKAESQSEDEVKEHLESIQAITDEYTDIIERIVAEKEKDVLTV